MMSLLWRSEGNVQESVLFFHHMGPRYQTQVVRFGGKTLYPLSHFSSPQSFYVFGTMACFLSLGMLF